MSAGLLILLTVAGLAALAFLGDRLLLAMEARGWIYWRRTKGLSSIGADLLQEGDPAARAARQAMEQERVRKNVRPAEDPPFRVDLDAGTVSVRRTASGGPPGLGGSLDPGGPPGPGTTGP